MTFYTQILPKDLFTQTLTAPMPMSCSRTLHMTEMSCSRTLHMTEMAIIYERYRYPLTASVGEFKAE